MKLNFISKGYFKDIDEFMFLKQIGVGSFGKVELALHIETNKFYAIKAVKLDSQDLDEKQILLLERQIYLHSQVDHPYIVKLWDTIGRDKSVYLIMELAQNSSLFAYQNKKKTLTEFEAFKYFNQTLNAVQYLHSLNIMHRDIKPQNILLDKNYNVKLCDLGWATQQINQKRKTFCGTYQYMAPQMAFQKQYTYKIDVWALGVLLYELLHGYAPFKGRSLEDIKQKISKGYYQINNGFSKDLKHLIIDLLQFDPQCRPQLSAVKNYAWIQNMKKQVLKQGLKIKQQICSFAQENNQKRSSLKKEKANQTSEQKKHKRIQSMDQKCQRKFYQNNVEIKKSSNGSKKFLQTQFSEIFKKMKKKCKTQGQESLQKYQTQTVKSISKSKLVNTSNSELKKQSEKQNSTCYKTNFLKWNNFPEFNSNQTKYQNANISKFQNKCQNISMNKIKKISQKINQISQKIDKSDKKKMRLKTHNFF